jgi:chromate transporter
VDEPAQPMSGDLGAPAREETAGAGTLRGLLWYFLYLGTFGFGGPIALAGYMQRDLVERRGWITKEDYKQGLALAQLAPGPLAAQLAMYLGWVKGGALGATAVGAAFVVPSFFMVMGLSALYTRYGGLPWMQGAFYGIGAAVIAIVGRSAVKLVNMTLTRDGLLWALFVVSAVVTAWTESEIVWLFLASGVAALVVRGRPPAVPAAGVLVGPGVMAALATVAAPAAANGATLARIGLYFAEAGAFVFGSGLAIVPFLHGGVVNQFHWLSERQFLDAVAVAMITPGPVVITVAFIGYLVAGPLGATAAALGVFLPSYLFVIIPAPYFRRIASNHRVKAFVDGVTAAATGAIAGAAFVLGRRALIDLPTIAIAAITFVLVTKLKKLPEPLVIAGAAVVGLVLKGVMG